MTATDPATLAGLRAAIVAEPRDDTPRLIYADAIEESDPTYAAFIRVQCALFKRQPGNSLRHRQAAKMVGQFAESLGGKGWIAVASRHSYERYVRIVSRIEGMRVVLFRRGFVAEVACTLADWMRYGPRLVREWPVEHVTAVDRRAVEPEWIWTCLWSLEDPPGNHHYLSESVYRLLPNRGNGYAVQHVSCESADTALSAALLAWARLPTSA